MKKSYEMDMCNGPLVGKILLFAFPLMLSSVLQLLFNAADIVVVGRFTGAEALAAVGATSALINLLVNVFMGLSIGTNVLTAQGYGARNEKGVQDTVHTSIMLSLVCGVLLIFIGVFLAAPLLELMPQTGTHQKNKSFRKHRFFFQNPFFNGNADGIRKKLNIKIPVFFILEHIPHVFPDHGNQQIPEIFCEGILSFNSQCFLIKIPIFIKISTDIFQESPLTVIIFIFCHADKFIIINPVYQVIFIFEMIIKAFPAHIAPAADIADADRAERHLCHELFQGICQCFFCDI